MNGSPSRIVPKVTDLAISQEVLSTSYFSKLPLKFRHSLNDGHFFYIYSNLQTELELTQL